MTLGEKLAKLRKEHNYTQEEFAALLEVSRQAVSKWESDLAYPETDRLIKLSELFGCSIDYLLKEDAPAAPTETASETKIDTNCDIPDETEITSHIPSEKLKKDEDEKESVTPKQRNIISGISGSVLVITAIIYIILGAVCNLWHPAWILLFLIPIISSLADAIVKKNPSHFAYPVLVTAVFLLIGFLAHKWHPGWVVFLTIPVYYIIAEAITGKKKK